MSSEAIATSIPGQSGPSRGTQGLGFRVSRVVTIVVTGIAATAAAAWLLFLAPSFLDTLNSSLELAVTVLGPLVAVYAVDLLLRRNRYDGKALAEEQRDGPFWYRHGVFWPGVIAMTVATTTAVLMANTTLFVGPIALALGGADLSAIVPPVLAGSLYAVLWMTTTPYRDPAARPAASWRGEPLLTTVWRISTREAEVLS